ncbi:MAG TPA: CUAEP/CCAEP-tail radical SAM protein, partial [Vicinamibacterales bacterium]|nr:CUAEP/CCAEP-tail radical SAM protein [Vicinamibacterales bacterium]
MVVLLLSTYELGRQPFGLASPAAWLRRSGADVRCIDLSREPLDTAAVARADVVAIHVPMHTATRLAVPVIERVRRDNPAARLVVYGLYAPPNAEYLRALGVHVVLGPEAEADLVALAAGAKGLAAPRAIPRLPFITPDRTGLPALTSYASLHLGTGERQTVGYTEATRGCKHRCRHCPIVPVYDGQFRVVGADAVLGDIRAQVAGGAQHITFGDPDFLNGPTHARRIVEALAREWPGLTFDVVIKIEHILRHRELMPVLRDSGCLFVTSAVESVDDRVLERLDKGHTRADFEHAAAWLREIGLPLVPTFVAFTPWTTLATYVEMLDAIEHLDLVDHVAPVQLAIRLLIPNGSRLLELPEIRARIGGFDPRQLAHTWTHADSAVDALQREVMGLVGSQVAAPRRWVFDAVRGLVQERVGAGGPRFPTQSPRVDRA